MSSEVGFDSNKCLSTRLSAEFQFHSKIKTILGTRLIYFEIRFEFKIKPRFSLTSLFIHHFITS